MDIAVLGMGSMGRSVALRLLDQGHRVAIWNRTPGRDAEVVRAGGNAAASPTEAAAGAAAVLVSLADDSAVRSVVLGAGTGEPGLLSTSGSSLPTGAVLVDMSTVSPRTTREVAAATPGGRMLAAPIMGAPHAVRQGTASYVLAGPKELMDSLDDLWSALSSNRRWCGEDQGLATTLKLIGNYLLMTGVATLAEAVATGQRAGLDDRLLREFLSTAPLVAPALQNRLEDILGGDHQGWFSAVLGAKDLRLVGELAAESGLELPVGSLVKERYEALAERGLAEADIAAVVELLR